MRDGRSKSYVSSTHLFTAQCKSLGHRGLQNVASFHSHCKEKGTFSCWRPKLFAYRSSLKISWLPFVKGNLSPLQTVSLGPSHQKFLPSPPDLISRMFYNLVFECLTFVVRCKPRPDKVGPSWHSNQSKIGTWEMCHATVYTTVSYVWSM